MVFSKQIDIPVYLCDGMAQVRQWNSQSWSKYQCGMWTLVATSWDHYLPIGRRYLTVYQYRDSLCYQTIALCTMFYTTEKTHAHTSRPTVTNAMVDLQPSDQTFKNTMYIATTLTPIVTNATQSLLVYTHQIRPLGTQLPLLL